MFDEVEPWRKDRLEWWEEDRRFAIDRGRGAQEHGVLKWQMRRAKVRKDQRSRLWSLARNE